MPATVRVNAGRAATRKAARHAPSRKRSARCSDSHACPTAPPTITPDRPLPETPPAPPSAPAPDRHDTGRSGGTPGGRKHGHPRELRRVTIAEAQQLIGQRRCGGGEDRSKSTHDSSVSPPGPASPSPAAHPADAVSSFPLLQLPEALQLDIAQRAIARKMWSASSPAHAARLRDGMVRLFRQIGPLAARMCAGHPILRAEAAAPGLWGTPAYCRLAFEDSAKLDRPGGRWELLGWARANGCPWAHDVRTRVATLAVPEGVASLPSGCFAWCIALQTVRLPHGLAAMGSETFSWCTALWSIRLPDGLTQLGRATFNECAELRFAWLPDTLTAMGNSTFAGCAALTRVHLPAELTEISTGTFCWCTSLTSVWLSDRITQLGSFVFRGCTALESVRMPDELSGVGDGVFDGCTALKHVTVPTRLRAVITALMRSQCRVESSDSDSDSE